MPATAEQQQLTESLLNHIADVHFPSRSQLDRVEQLISTREELETYIGLLTQKVEQTSFAAAPMLDRIQRLLRVLQRFDRETRGED